MMMDPVMISGEIVDKVLEKHNSLRNLIFQSNFRRKAILQKVVSESLRHRAVIERIEAEVPQLRLRSPLLDSSAGLRLVALYEFLFAPMGLKSPNKQLQSGLERFRGDLITAKNLMIDEGLLDKEGKLVEEKPIELPRYARVNTLANTTAEVLEILQEEFYSVIHAPEDCKRDKYVELVDALGTMDVLVDPVVPDLLVFAARTDLHRHPLVTSSVLVLQDKASCLPVLCLDPRPGKAVMDVCAAPGMKTSHLAALMANDGAIFSFDRDPRRTAMMTKLVAEKGVTIADVRNKDFLKVDVKAAEFRKIRLALVDPPCSGSGIVSRKEFTATEDGALARRLASLSCIQAMLLKHALSLPNVDRVVYSTCSVHTEENEAVIAEIVESEDFGERFEVVKAIPGWKHRGKRGWDFSKLCLRASPEKDRTNGFFVCVIQRKLIG